MSSMETILYIRAILINIYKRYEAAWNYAFKFIVGLCLFGIINKIGMPREELEFINSYFTGTATLILISFMFAVLPTTASFFLLVLDVTVQTSSHLELSLMGFLLMLCLVLFYVRMAPKESWLIILTLLGFYLKIPYIAPIFAGMYFSLASAIPIMIGVFIWEFAPYFVNLVKVMDTADLDIIKLTTTVGPAITGLLEGVSANYSWVFISFVFSMTILIVYVISHLTMDYAKELAILFGGLLCMIGLLLVQMIADVAAVGLGSGAIFIFSILSMVLMYAIHFFDLALDYKRAERVEFSDEDNYYYVRVIPKLILTEQKKKSGRPATTAKKTSERSRYDYD